MFANPIGLLLSNFSLAMLILACVFSMIQWATHQKMSTYEILYSWVVLLCVGLSGLYGFIMHAFFPDMAAAAIGWQNSPFQFEVAMANLGFGILGILSFRASYGFRLATVVGNVCWLWGDASGHIYQMVKYHNFTSGNAGSWFWADMIVPLILLFCIIKIKSTLTSELLFL
jgi:hypothetical protein